MWDQDVEPLHATSYYLDIGVLRVSKKPLELPAETEFLFFIFQMYRFQTAYVGSDPADFEIVYDNSRR
jgi:hypothetical protein